MAEKYIIDVDTGVDDAQAIMLALSRHDVEVVAITCVAGNVNVDQVCLNTLKVLTVCGRLDVPVFKGSNQPLVDEGFEATHYHGFDGLGDAELDIAVSMDQLQKERAVSAMLRLVNEYPGEINLVALAPLTNIAIALKQDADFGKKLKRVTIMGGNTQATGRVSPCAEFNFYCDPEAAFAVLAGIEKARIMPYELNANLNWVGVGNSTLCGEFNFACDPDAAFVVLNEISVPITLFPWEINLSSATGQRWDWFDKWVETDSPKGEFNKAITRVAVQRQRVERKLPIYRSCDLNAMATAIEPKVVTETEDVYATVELHGKFTRGMMVVDWRRMLKKSPNVTLIKEIDTNKTRPMFEHMLKLIHC